MQATRVLCRTAQESVIAWFILAGAGALNCMLRCEIAPETSIVSPCRVACATQPQLQREVAQMAHRVKNIAQSGFGPMSAQA